MKSVGIDPGAEGCIVLLDTLEKTARYMFIPYRKDKMINSKAIMQGFDDFYDVDRITIEKVMGRGGDSKWGAAQNFGLGVNYGKILQVFEMLPHFLATPASWQREIHKGVTANTAKEKTMAVFDKINPSYGGIKNSKNGLSDAFFIARYGLDCLKCNYRDDWNFIKLD